jgi:hypothetical protein
MGVFTNFENRARTKDGRDIWLSTNGFPRLDDAGNLLGYRGNDTDITAEKQARAQLAQREAMLASMLENLPWTSGPVTWMAAASSRAG